LKIHTSGILITVSNRILIGNGGARFAVVVSVEESSIVSSGLVKPCVNLFTKYETMFLFK
jgi:hypothetical protein